MAYKPAHTSDALWRLWQEFSEVEPDAVFAGTFAAKSGYHNTRYNHVHGINGGKPTDYSITDRVYDRRGSDQLTGALDITFRTAQRGVYDTIKKYSRRLDDAMRRDDSLLLHDGICVLREYFGNLNGDRVVDGYSLFRERRVSSDPSHLWHIHQSFTRQFVEDWDKLEGVLYVLLDKRPALKPTSVPKPSPAPSEDSELNAVEKKQLEDVHYAVTKIGSLLEPTPKAPLEDRKEHSAGYYLATTEARVNNLQNSQQALEVKVGELDAKLDAILAKLNEPAAVTA